LPVTIAIANTDFQLVQMQKDYYQILAIIDSAEDVVIKAAYKALIHIYHPDRYEGDKHEATQKTKDILEAYRVLSNPESRAEYDQSRGVTPKQAKPQTPVKPHRMPVFDFQSLALPMASDNAAVLATMSESQLRGLVKQGDIDAQMELGKRYFNGNGLQHLAIFVKPLITAIQMHKRYWGLCMPMVLVLKITKSKLLSGFAKPPNKPITMHNFAWDYVFMRGLVLSRIIKML
jgi:hypothetical protein